MRSALIHDWLISSVGGGEKVLEALHRLYPSPIFTLVHDPKKLKGSYFEGLDIISSFIQKMPLAKTKYKNYLPFFPLAIEQLNVKEYDLIISSSHCAAKGVITSADQLHICYCHTPMRYAWDLMHEYLEEANLSAGIKSVFAKLILHYLRSWDTQSSNRVDYFVANSRYVAKRIAKIYQRQAEVIYPGVDISAFHVGERKEEYYITASRLVPYKKVDLIVSAFAKMPDKKLVVIGKGPEFKKIQKRATKNVELLGEVSDGLLKEYLQKAKGFVFAAIEDFGIAPVEAMASGTPVIAFAKGGALETVVSGKSGIFYPEATEKGLIEAITAFEKQEFDPIVCRKRAEEFSLTRFNQDFCAFVEKKRCLQLS